MEGTSAGTDPQEGGQEVKITMAHMRQVKGFTPKGGFCAKGVRRWFNERGLDYSAFLKEGIDEEVLLRSGDPMAKAVVEQAHGKQ